MRKIFLSILVAIFGVLSTISCSNDTSHELVISDAWVRSSEYSSESGGMTGVFAKLTNNSNHEIRLVGGDTAAAALVQIHEVVDGMMREKKGGISIPPGETVILEPGGLHVMLMNLTSPIVSGDEIQFTFSFDSAESQSLKLQAKNSFGGDEKYSGTK